MPLIHSLPVGAHCVYYIHGDITPENAAGAIVFKNYGNGVLELNVFGQGSITHRDCVRHRDDPDLLSFPEARRRQGCWDYVHYTKNGLPPISAEDTDQAVTESLRNGLSPDQIADTLKVSLKTVDSIAKKIKG